VRGKGAGAYAAQIKALFRGAARKLGMERPPDLSAAAFRPPSPPGQLSLF